jgi:Rrf2 family protein
MQITRAGEYGVRGLTYLARRAPGQTAMIEEISRAERIPRSFLAKIFQSLARTGLVKSARGAGGGFALSKTPANITILEIIEAVEGRFLLQRCLQAETECELLGGCALCDLLGEAQDGMRGPLSRTSLRDLMEKQDRIERAKNALNPAHTIP